MKKETRILTCVLAFLCTFALASCGGVKDWFEKKIGFDDSSSDSESFLVDPSQCSSHVDVDDDGKYVH